MIKNDSIISIETDSDIKLLYAVMKKEYIIASFYLMLQLAIML